MFDELLEANRRQVAMSRPDPLPAPPARGLAILTCMDARLVPLDAFGLAAGDAHVIRNAGGRATDDTVRSLAVSTHVYGVRWVAVVHHTECGMATWSQSRLAAMSGRGDGQEIDFRTITDAGRAILDDVKVIAGSGLLAAGTAVAGFRYDVHGASLTQVTEVARCA